MPLITPSQYWNEVELTATRVISRARDESEGGDLLEVINGNILFQEIGDHEWIKYNIYNLDVIQYSENVEYYIDNFGVESAGETLKARGLTGLHTAIAFWAMYADAYGEVIDRLDD